MNSTVSPPTAAVPVSSPEASAARLLLVRSEGTRTLLTGPDAAPQSVGAGPRCSIRLDGPGLRPLHCVITPTADGAVIRRWAAETRLNGDDFTEARLSAGDIVRVGSIDLRVIELLRSPLDRSSEDDSQPADTDTPVAAPSADAGLETATPASPEAEVAVPEVAESSDDASVESSAMADEEGTDTAEDIAETPVETGPVAGAVDPAIPSHLLTPWTGSENDQLTVKRDTATSAVPLNAFDEPEQASPQESTPAAVAPLDGEWAVASPDASEDVEAIEPAVELSADWIVDASEASASTTPPTPGLADKLLEAVRSLQPAADQSQSENGSTEFEYDLDPAFATSEAAAPSEPAVESAVPRGRSHEGRLASSRLRVKNLVAALRAEREQATLWQTAVAEREAALLAAQDQVSEASVAAELSEATRQELAKAAERIASLEAEHAAAIAAAEAATDRAEALEQQLASQQMTLAVSEQVAAEPARDADLDHEVAREDETASQPEEPETALPIWAQEQVAETPAATELPVELVAASEPEAVIETEARSASEAPEEPAASEDLWGIEQLASDECQSSSVDAESATQVADLPEPTAEEVTASPAEVADEAELFESSEDELAASPSEHIVLSAALEAATPAHEAEVEPAPIADEALGEPDEPVTGFKDPFARPETEAADEPHEAPASFIEQFAHLMPEDDEPVEPPVPLAEPAPVVAEMAPIAESNDEESIDDYMRKLMGRVRGGGPTSSGSASSAGGDQAGPAAKPTAVELPKPTEPVVPIRDLSELKRVPNREMTTDMGALRKLANQSARHAIDVAATRQSREQATLRLTSSAVAIGCGALAAITAMSPFDLQFVGGILGLSAGSWFGLRTLRACQQAAQQDELEAAAAGESVG